MKENPNLSKLINYVKGNVIIQKLIWTIFLLWFCYVPEVRLDLQHSYVKTGYLVLSGSRNGSYHLFNGKAVCEAMTAIGCESGFRRNNELKNVEDGRTPIELTFAPNVGNALNKSDIVVEIKRDGQPLPGYTTNEMAKHMNAFWTRYLFSIIIFTFFFPLILFPDLLKYFQRG
ncbi:hypothetical protein [Methylophilus sp. 3sh_L]|uniref:hypothetical protein n=1 Tax=Methylophilus sp. 3sh_L TaxID=3377114 RepID=UPI00398F4DE1